MGNRLPLAIKQAEGAVLFGFDALRPLANEAGVQEAYDYLQRRFGEAIIPFDQEQDLYLVRAAESGTALIRAGVRALGTEAVKHVMQEVHTTMPDELKEPLVAETPYFSVTKHAVSSGNQLITIRLANDDRHAKQRKVITGLIDAQTQTPFVWPQYRALIPLAYLGDKALAQTIRGIRRQDPTTIALEGIHLRRPAALQ